MGSKKIMKEREKERGRKKERRSSKVAKHVNDVHGGWNQELHTHSGAHLYSKICKNLKIQILGKILKSKCAQAWKVSSYKESPNYRRSRSPSNSIWKQFKFFKIFSQKFPKIHANLETKQDSDNSISCKERNYNNHKKPLSGTSSPLYSFHTPNPPLSLSLSSTPLCPLSSCTFGA